MFNTSAFNYINVLDRAADASWIRNEAIANNIANVDTPGYKRQDVNFEEQLRRAMKNSRYKSIDERVDNIDLEKFTKEQLKEISYAKEERGVAVIHGGKISGHCYMPQEVKPARSMPMILTAANGFISIKLKKDKEGIFLY